MATHTPKGTFNAAVAASLQRHYPDWFGIKVT
jgi:hypothetical protein